MPFSSPTTTRAVNEKRRPPLTTLATRLISTTRSWRSRLDDETDRSGAGMAPSRVAVRWSVPRPARPVGPGSWMPGGDGRRGIVAAPQTPSDGADPAPRDSAERSWGSWNRPSKFEAALAGAVGQGLHAAVVLVAAAVEHGG